MKSLYPYFIKKYTHDHLMWRNNMLKTMTVIWAVLNVAVYILMMLDKWYAKTDKWRISESMLIGLSIIGGSFGLAMGMICFKHKINKLIFKLVACLGMTAFIAFIIYLVMNQSLQLVNF